MLDRKTRKINLTHLNQPDAVDEYFLTADKIMSDQISDIIRLAEVEDSDTQTLEVSTHTVQLPDMTEIDISELKKTIQKPVESITVLPRIDTSSANLKFVVENQRRYQILKKIGQGGAGDVELALDRDIYRLVAIKRLKKNLHNSMMLMRFVNEIRVVGHLEHPNIIPIHDVGVDEDGQYFFVMRYAPGETLQSVIDKLKQGDREYHKKYTFPKRVAIFVEILKAVEFAHFNGIIHRDLKPGNIMIGSHGEVMVLDWGISKRIRSDGHKEMSSQLLDKFEREVKEADRHLPLEERIILSENDFAIGTLAYMAPEQAQGLNDKHDERTDVYALSALFYEFLTLKSYMTPKSSVVKILKAISEEKPKFAMKVSSKFQKPVPADLSHFLVKGLQKHPADRYQSLHEMQTMINKIVEGYAPVQCPFTLSTRIIHGIAHFMNERPMGGLLMLIFLSTFFITGIYLIYDAIRLM